MPLPFERQDYENDESFAMFVQFRDLPPPRRLERLRRVGWTLQQLVDVYRTCCWAARVAAWDSHLDAVRREMHEQAAADEAANGAARNAACVRGLRDLFERELAKWQRDSEEVEAPVTRHATDLAKLGETVIKYSRLLKGESTEHTKVDLGRLSDEDLEAILRHARQQNG